MANGRNNVEDLLRKTFHYQKSFLKTRRLCIHNTKKENFIDLFKPASKLDKEIDPARIF